MIKMHMIKIREILLQKKLKDDKDAVSIVVSMNYEKFKFVAD